MESYIKGKQLTEIGLNPSTTPLDINNYTVSATGSGKQIVNKEYLDNLPGLTPSSLQDTTDIGNTTSNDIEITDSDKGYILKSPDGTRWRLTINNDGQIIASSL
jgi:hypothetical protein